MDAEQLSKLLRGLSAAVDVGAGREMGVMGASDSLQALDLSERRQKRPGMAARRVSQRADRDHAGDPRAAVEREVSEQLRKLAERIRGTVARQEEELRQRVLQELERFALVQRTSSLDEHPLVDLLLAYGARDTSAIQQHAAHVSACIACRAVLDSYERHAGLIEASVRPGDAEGVSLVEAQPHHWSQILTLRSRISTHRARVNLQLRDALRGKELAAAMDLLANQSHLLTRETLALDRLRPPDHAELAQLNNRLDQLDREARGQE